MLSLDPMGNQSAFFHLPLDVRNRVYEMIFFAKEKKKARGLNRVMTEFQARKLNWASTGLVGSSMNQIHPYRKDSKYQPKYDLSIFRTNRQIQEEAERVFYGWSSFNLTTDAYAPGDYSTFQFFQSLPPRYRKLIRRVEIRCFHRCAPHTSAGNNRLMYLFDWNAFMKFLALECLSLRSLILWGFADGVEGEELERSCTMSSDWVQSILQIKTLRFFDIRAIPRRKIVENQSCVPKVLQELRNSLYQQGDASRSFTTKSILPTPGSEFPLMQLPCHIRKRIYRFALLPANEQLHPYLKPWYDVTTRNVVPLFLTCRQIQKEAEEVLYGQAIFHAPAHKYDQPLNHFLQTLPPHLSRQINQTVTYTQMLAPFLDNAMANKHLTTFDYVQNPDNNNNNDDNDADAPMRRYQFVADHLHKPWPLKRINIETNDEMRLSPLLRDWITQGFMDLGLFHEGHLILRLSW